MALFEHRFTLLLSCAVVLVFLSSPVAAFGAGNIASIARIEGQNWRHGDIEDTLLTMLMSRAAGGKKFGKLDVKRVYFGNWLRDYSQAVDVGTVKYVSAEAIRIILWVLGFMSFGYATKEFEVTADRLGCYRPEEHIDNPKDYADNLDARDYDPRLRGPVDERRELAINPQTGLKNYIATENMNIASSAGLVRNLYGRSIQLGQKFARSVDKADLYEALRLLGTANHCLEDYSAHSNYTELALIELNERGVFPHVGRQTKVNLPGARQAVYPIVTGTFGGVDFLHSVMGEFSDKATQSEIQELQGTIQESQNSGSGNVSLLQDLLNQVPDGLFGGKDQSSAAADLQANATAAQMQNTRITPRQPEAWTKQLQEVSKQIYPILQWHDEIMQSITETIEKIPILPDLVEQLQEQINVFVFSLLAPFVLPIINQVKTELATGSSEIIQSSKEKQLIVFRDDRSSDPTHSMLSKDHFSNILNEPAGKIASQVLKWVIPQIIACWDDERIDVNRTLSRIVNGVFHHPALRDYGDDGAIDGRRLMFGVVQNWWGQKDERERSIMRDQLSRDGVLQGRNHKEGVQDTGHGCCKPLGMPTTQTASSSGAIGGPAAGAILGQIGSALAGQSMYDTGYTGTPSAGAPGAGIGKFAEEAVGGGAIGGLLGGLIGDGGDLLGGMLGEGSNVQTQGYQSNQYEADGGYTQSYTETGYTKPHGGSQPQYGQAQYSQTTYPGGVQREEYQRYEQEGQSGRTGYGQQVITETRPTYGGGYEQTTETRYERPGGAWDSEVRHESRTSGGRSFEETSRYEGSNSYLRQSRESSSAYNTQSEYNEEPRRYENGTRYGQSRTEYETEAVSERVEEPSYQERGRPRYEEGFEQERPAYSGGFGRQEEFERTEEYDFREETKTEEGFEQERPAYGSRQEEYGREEEYGGREEAEREDEYEEERRW
ncbi:MAG: hypothetical protein FRX48_01441 [Lasallia pustulata]|uniref:Heterokaryon incompatibility Het-C n=1 Tax=Lasallia pustulata TaxID=136370 RepID=A0A5M8PY75_9LECA|nr:MAG: hypothetical protein FRX48_01441 [Lasallia pustulata]